MIVRAVPAGLFAATLATTGLAAQPAFHDPLNAESLQTNEVYLVDARCSAAFQIMSDFGKERGSDLADIYAQASQYLVVVAVGRHEKEFGTSHETASSIVKDITLSDHEVYLAGLTSGEQQGLAVFTVDVAFCNQHLRGYEAAITGITE